jgi:hypothetical protein
MVVVARVPLVMLAKEIGPIVVAVGRPDHCMDVVARRCIGAAQRDRALVIKLDQDDRLWMR